MFRISFLLAFWAFGGVAAQDSSAPSAAPVVQDSNAPSVLATVGVAAPTCFPYCCQLAANIRALDPACADWGTDACGECEIPAWCLFIPDGPARCNIPVCCADDNGGDMTGSSGFCPLYCCEVEADIRAFNPTCASWGTDACGECKIPDWCDTIPKSSRCNTPVCCSDGDGAGTLSTNTVFAIVAGFVALLLQDFAF